MTVIDRVRKSDSGALKKALEILKDKVEIDEAKFSCQVFAYQNLLLERNKRTQLISRKDEDVVLERHIIESLAPALAVEFKYVSRLVDIGSGAGLPGIPLALLFPEIKFFLVDSRARRTDFLQEVVSGLELKNVNVIWGRIENISKDEIENASIFIARAVSSLEKLWAWSLVVAGMESCRLLAMKGGELQKEIAALKKKYRNVSVDVLEYDHRLVASSKERFLVNVYN
ncbi:MAG: 16S rRNA (guanine(527)-N(7))-methyltransferase RsmG [Calditrichaeota bacterium]|nr:MAG: 16S rRNA (guanine(527)-N(7))-methyltransferase RsmG [Calditrichota bacterium]